jgi:urea transport system ATP-binding protein
MLSIRDLSFSYGAIPTLRGINMEMTKGCVTCVMGRNGVGKTTLMRNIMGVLRSSGGTVMLGEKNLSSLAAHRRAKSGLALVPQGRDIFPKLTIEENLKIGLEARADRSRTIPEEVYALFPVLKKMARRMGGDLSGGQQQQLAIARALVGGPKVLLLDEPTEGIQPSIIDEIGQALHKFVDELHLTVVVVEQYLDFVREFGQNFYIMNRGRVVAEGTTAELTPDVVAKHLSV